MDIVTYALLNKKVDNINEQIKDLTNETTLYKHKVNLTIIFDEVPEVFTLEFLSKYNTPFVNNGSLEDMLVFYSSLNDTHAIINPMVILGNTYAIISQILPNGDTGINISVVTNTTFVLNALYQDNASGITDTVTPYINFVGSAGGGSGKLYMYDFRAKLYDYNGDEVLNSEKQFRLGIYESNFERFKAQASQLGLILNTPQDLVTLINNFDETTGTTDFNRMFLFLELIANVDLKYFVYASTNTSYVEQINWNFFVGSLFTSIDSQEFSIADMNEGTEYYRGINTMNSCTLTEYGTSGGGSSVVNKKYYNFVLQDSDGANSLSLQINIPYETMQDVYDEINQALGGNISTPQEVIAVYDSLKADNISGQAFTMLIQLFSGLAQVCLFKNLNNIYNDGDGYFKISGLIGLVGPAYNGNAPIFSDTLTSNKISFTSTSTLIIHEYDEDQLD